MLQLEARSSCLIVAGMSGSGKTTLALRYIVADRGINWRFIFDPEGEFSQRLNVVAAETVSQLGYYLELDQGFALFDPHTIFPGGLDAAFDWFCQWTFEEASRLPGRKVLLLDEAWKYCDRLSIPRSLATCVQTGRKRGLETVFTTQLPHKLNGSVLNEATEAVCFSLQEEKALDFAQSRSFAREEVAALPLGSFVARNLRTNGELRARLW
jgi:hypothetical protein